MGLFESKCQPEHPTHFLQVKSSDLKAMGGSFVELPETDREAKAIKEILSAPDDSAPLQLREFASYSKVIELNAQERLADYRYLLFACHGILPNEVEQVDQPALVLSLPDAKTGKEEFLTMADVFSLRLNADLVTLSACNTGLGEVKEAEGVVGLTRAFMYAGTPAVTVTLWTVESKSTGTLSIDLYSNLRSGKPRAEALREAKLSMIRGDKGGLFSHPYFWAPVVLFGDGN